MVPVATLLYIQGLQSQRNSRLFYRYHNTSGIKGRRLLAHRFMLLHVSLAGTDQTPEGETSQRFNASGGDYFSSQFHSLWISFVWDLCPCLRDRHFQDTSTFVTKNSQSCCLRVAEAMQCIWPLFLVHWDVYQSALWR